MGHRLAELADLVGGRVEGNGDREIEGVRSLESAGPTDLSYLTDRRYRRQAAASGAGALLVDDALDVAELGERDLLRVEQPAVALIPILERLYPRPAAAPGVHPTAVVEEDCEIDPSACLGPYVVVGAGSVIGPGAVLHAGVVVGRSCRIGADTELYPRVVLYDRTELGERVIVHAGVVLGSDGFGYTYHDGRHVKIPHVGRLVVEADVEIGANSAVDRATVDETRIGEGSKIDNLVQVGHNVRIGRAVLLCGQAGVSGSSKIGDGVVLAGKAGIADHVEIGAGAKIAALSAALQDVPAGETVAGIPAIPVARWLKSNALLSRLADLRRRVRSLEKELEASRSGRKKGGRG